MEAIRLLFQKGVRVDSTGVFGLLWPVRLHFFSRLPSFLSTPAFLCHLHTLPAISAHGHAPWRCGMLLSLTAVTLSSCKHPLNTTITPPRTPPSHHPVSTPSQRPPLLFGPPSTADRDGATPLHRASWAGKVNAIQTLLAMGATLGSTDKLGAQPLHQAVRNGQLEAVRSLLTAGADVAATDRDGDTALHEVRGLRTGLLLALGAGFCRGLPLPVRPWPPWCALAMVLGRSHRASRCCAH